MAKAKRISVNALEKVVKDTYAPTVTFNWNDIEVTVKKNLSLREMLEFVNDVTKSCFTADTSSYMPEIKDFAIKACVLEMYANFTMPRNVEAKYDLIYHTDAFESVLNHINMRQFGEICHSIDKKIENLAQANIEAVNKQMNELYNAFNNLQSHLSNLFTDIQSEDIQKIAGAMAEGGLSEEALVKAYMSQKNIEAGDQ